MEDVAENIPETPITETSVEDKKESVEDYKSDVDFLSRNDDKEEESDNIEEVEEEKEEKVEEKIEEKVEDDKEPPPLTAKDLIDRINKSNPEFLRKNKDVREAIYKNAQYSELFSHPDEAKEIVENYQAFDRLAGTIMQGDARALLHNIEQTNKNSLRTFAKSFPLALYEQDKTVFYDEIATPILASALREMIEEGKKAGNENLKRAAHWASQHIFNQPEPPALRKNERDPEKEGLQRELRENTIAVYQTQKQDIRNQTDNHLATLIVKDLDKGTSDKLKIAFARDVMDDLEESLSSDDNHLRRMNALWDQFVNSKFHPSIGNKIRATYVNRAKLLIPGLIAKHKPGYFGETVVKKTIKPIVPGGGSVKTTGKVDPSKIDWRKTSDLDILSGRATLKK